MIMSGLGRGAGRRGSLATLRTSSPGLIYAWHATYKPSVALLVMRTSLSGSSSLDREAGMGDLFRQGTQGGVRPDIPRQVGERERRRLEDSKG